jgi:Phosphotransferase enzyme family
VITEKVSWEEVRNLIEKEVGPIRAVTELAEGRNSEISVIIRTDSDVTFVKGRMADHRQAWTQERERIVNPLVRHISPVLKWSVVNADWDILGFEYIPGTHADYAPGSLDIPKVIAVLLQLQEITCPDINVKQADQRWASYTSVPDLLAGKCLLHTDWSPGNVLVNERAYLIDWAWPTRGAAWIDPACLAVWLIASGHTPRSAESWTARIPSWRSASAIALDEFARVQALMWDGIAADSSELWTKNLAQASRQWARHRESRSSPNGNQDE